MMEISVFHASSRNILITILSPVNSVVAIEFTTSLIKNVLIARPALPFSMGTDALSVLTTLFGILLLGSVCTVLEVRYSSMEVVTAHLDCIGLANNV